VSKTVFDVIEREKLVERAAQLGEHAMSRLRKEPRIAEKVVEVRGRGLMLGIELKFEPQKLVEKGLAKGVLINLTAKKVLRLAPPINITPALWDQGLDRLIDTIGGLDGERK
jgi:acetylornithine aminotransferase